MQNWFGVIVYAMLLLWRAVFTCYDVLCSQSQTNEEEEFMQNCFDVLCSCLMVQSNKLLFVKVRKVFICYSRG